MSLVEEFVSVTGTDEATAKFYLELGGHDLTVALDFFFSSHSSAASSSAQTATVTPPPPVAPVAPVPPVMTKKPASVTPGIIQPARGAVTRKVSKTKSNLKSQKLFSAGYNNGSALGYQDSPPSSFEFTQVFIPQGYLIHKILNTHGQTVLFLARQEHETQLTLFGSGQHVTAVAPNKETPTSRFKEMYKGVQDATSNDSQTCVVTDNGFLYWFTSSTEGSAKCCENPFPGEDAKLKKMCAGYTNVLFLLDNGSLYIKTGSDLTSKVSLPYPVENCYCGSEYQMAICYDAQAKKQRLYGWGNNGQGQLGVGDNNFYGEPVNIDIGFVGNRKIKAMALTYYVAVMLLDDDSFYITGGGDKFLAMCQTNSFIPFSTPAALKSIKSMHHSVNIIACVQNNGDVWVAGENMNGELGCRQDFVASFEKFEFSLLVKHKKLAQIELGGWSTFLLFETKLDNIFLRKMHGSSGKLRSFSSVKLGFEDVEIQFR